MIKKILLVLAIVLDLVFASLLIRAGVDYIFVGKSNISILMFATAALSALSAYAFSVELKYGRGNK